jgi:hypothetical protein
MITNKLTTIMLKMACAYSNFQKRPILSIQKAKSAQKTQIAKFHVFELDMERSISYSAFRQPFDSIAVANTAWQRQKAAGATSSDLRPIWLRR